MLSAPDIVSVAIYFSALFGTAGNLIVLFAFISNAFKNKVFHPPDRIIVNMALVNLLLCCYKEIPGMLVFFHTKVFDFVGCRILLYMYHTLRLVSIWSVENLSFLHLIKIRRPSYQWSKFIYRHQGRYVNWSLAGCWIFTITIHIPYLLYTNSVDMHDHNNIFITSTNCIGPSESSFLKVLTYFSLSIDFLLIILVIVLNWFTIDLIWRHRRQVRDTMTINHGWNKRTAQATKTLLSLLLLYVICWISSDLVWIAMVSGVIRSQYEKNILLAVYGTLSSIYYSVSSCIMVFGYRKVTEYLSKFICCKKRVAEVTQTVQQGQ